MQGHWTPTGSSPPAVEYGPLPPKPKKYPGKEDEDEMETDEEKLKPRKESWMSRGKVSDTKEELAHCGGTINGGDGARQT